MHQQFYQPQSKRPGTASSDSRTTRWSWVRWHTWPHSRRTAALPRSLSYIRNTTIGDDAAGRRTPTSPGAPTTAPMTLSADLHRRTGAHPLHDADTIGKRQFPGEPPATMDDRSATTGANAPPCWTALRLPLARTDGLQRRRSPRDRSAPASPACCRPRLRRRRVPAVDPRRAAHLPLLAGALSAPASSTTLGSTPKSSPRHGGIAPDEVQAATSIQTTDTFAEIPVFSTTLSSMSAIFATPSDRRSMSASGGLRSHHVGT